MHWMMMMMMMTMMYNKLCEMPYTQNCQEFQSLNSAPFYVVIVLIVNAIYRGWT